MDKTTVFEQIAASFNQFEALTTKWHDKWAEAPFEDRREWAALFNSLIDRIEFYDKLTRLEKRRLEFMSGAVEGAVVKLEGQLSDAQIEAYHEHIRTGDQPARMRAAGIDTGDRTPAEVEAILRARNP